MTPPLTSQVRLSPDAVYRRVEDEIVVLQLARSVYHSLDPVAARMLELLLAARDVEGALQGVTGEYEVERATAEADLLRLIEELHAAGLVVVTPSGAGQGPT